MSYIPCPHHAPTSAHPGPDDEWCATHDGAAQCEGGYPRRCDTPATTKMDDALLCDACASGQASFDAAVRP